MDEKGPTLAQRKKQLYRGMEVTLPSGRAGVFLEFCKGSREQAWVLNGGMKGPKIVVNIDKTIEKTFRD